MNKPDRQITERWLSVMVDHVGLGRKWPYKIQFAKAVKMTHQEIHNLESGRYVQYRHIITLNRITGVSFEWLLTGKGKKYPALNGNIVTFKKQKVK